MSIGPAAARIFATAIGVPEPVNSGVAAATYLDDRGPKVTTRARERFELDVTVNESACVGAGQCALIAGDLFDQDDDGIVFLLKSEIDSSDEAVARRAATLCPSRAIKVVE